MTDHATVCWDTTIFVAWFKSETVHPLDAIAEHAEQIVRGQLQLVVPTIVIAEFHAVSGHRNVVADFDLWIRANNATIADLTPAIAERAGDIRSTSPNKIKLMDSIIVATALEREVSIAWTADRKLLSAISKHPEIKKQSPFCYPAEGDLLFDD